ncbi:MAG: stage III sporulation protein AE [Agathobacter sp.]|nr:stage III sporulation protein AE [Agathobacter sp.]
MIRILMTDVSGYLEEIIETLDFSSLNNFLHEHMRSEMSFEELISQISLYGLEAINKENITQMFFDAVFYEMSIARPIFVKMLCFSVLFSVIHRLLVSRKTYVSNIGFLLIYSTLMVLLMQSFYMVREIALEGLNGILTFLNALSPTYAMTMVFTGNAVSGAVAYEMAFFFVYLIEFLMIHILSPLIHVFILVLFLNHLFEEDKLSKLAEFMEKIVAIILKVAFGAVIGLGVVQSLLTPMKDRLANNIMLSGLSAIPGIGGAVGSAGEIILSCGLLIKNSVGIIGLIVLFVVAVIPVLKIGCFWIMYHLLSILLQPVTDKRVVECVSGVARGCNLYLKIILYSMLLFFVLISMVTMATSFVF